MAFAISGGAAGGGAATSFPVGLTIPAGSSHAAIVCITMSDASSISGLTCSQPGTTVTEHYDSSTEGYYTDCRLYRVTGLQPGAVVFTPQGVGVGQWQVVAHVWDDTDQTTPFEAGQVTPDNIGSTATINVNTPAAAQYAVSVFKPGFGEGATVTAGVARSSSGLDNSSHETLSATRDRQGATTTVTWTNTTAGTTGLVAVAVNAVAVPTLASFEIRETNGSAVGNFAQGTARALRIRAIGSDGNVFTGFTGTVDITSTGTLAQGGGTSPAFVAGVLASRTFEFSAQGTGLTISCEDTDTGLVTGTSAAFAVTAPAALTSFDITELDGSPLGNFVEDVPRSVRIVALDQNSNVFAAFTDTVDVTSTGATPTQGEGTTGAFVAGVLASWPVSYPSLAAGVQLECADTDTGLITGDSAVFDVTLPPVAGGSSLIGGASALIS